MIDSVEHDVAEEVANRLSVEWLMQKLRPEEQQIMYLWAVEKRSFAEIGRLIGQKYRGHALTGSAIRYHKDQIRRKLAEFADAMGMKALNTPKKPSRKVKQTRT